MKRQKPTTFSSEMYQKALQQIHDLTWQLSLREAAWAAAEDVDRQKSEHILELEAALSDIVTYCKDGYGDHEADEIINAEKLLEPPQ